MPSYGENAGASLGAVVGGVGGAALGKKVGKWVEKALFGKSTSTKQAHVVYRYEDEDKTLPPSFYFSRANGEWVRDSGIAQAMYVARGGSPPSEWSSRDGGTLYIPSGFAGAVYTNGSYFDANAFGVSAKGKKFTDPVTRYTFPDVMELKDGQPVDTEAAKEETKSATPVWLYALIGFLGFKMFGD